MSKLCPICQSKMIPIFHDRHYTDYMCTPLDNKHHYAERNTDEGIERIKVRVNLESRRFYCQLFMNEGYSEIWEGIDSPNRVKIQKIIDLNFNDLPSIENKIKTYLVFS